MVLDAVLLIVWFAAAAVIQVWAEK